MKKMTLALVTLLSLGLAACSQHVEQENAYKGKILFSAYEGNNLKLTIVQNNCEASSEGTIQTLNLLHAYDSDLPVGACVSISQTEQGTVVKNISRSKSRSWIARSGQ